VADDRLKRQSICPIPNISAKATAVMKITHPRSELLADTDFRAMSAGLTHPAHSGQEVVAKRKRAARSILKRRPYSDPAAVGVKVTCRW
jgi:hypothetical protein